MFKISRMMAVHGDSNFKRVNLDPAALAEKSGFQCAPDAHTSAHTVGQHLTTESKSSIICHASSLWKPGLDDRPASGYAYQDQSLDDIPNRPRPLAATSSLNNTSNVWNAERLENISSKASPRLGHC
jgi:hypothetical protein